MDIPRICPASTTNARITSTVSCPRTHQTLCPCLSLLQIQEPCFPSFSRFSSPTLLSAYSAVQSRTHVQTHSAFCLALTEREHTTGLGSSTGCVFEYAVVSSRRRRQHQVSIIGCRPICLVMDRSLTSDRPDQFATSWSSPVRVPCYGNPTPLRARLIGPMLNTSFTVRLISNSPRPAHCVPVATHLTSYAPSCNHEFHNNIHQEEKEHTNTPQCQNK